jgi:hypothetical protein
MSSRACFLRILSRDHILHKSTNHDIYQSAKLVGVKHSLGPMPCMDGTQQETTDSYSRYDNIRQGPIQP